MIAGETEQLLADYLNDEMYDEFLFFGNKEKRLKRRAERKARRLKRRTTPKRLARKQKRKDFLEKVGKAYQDLGGGAAIGGAIDTLVSKPQPTQNIVETPSDYQVNIGDNEYDKKEDKTTQTVIYVAIGVVLLGGIGTLVYQSSKNKYIPLQN